MGDGGWNPNNPGGMPDSAAGASGGSSGGFDWLGLLKILLPAGASALGTTSATNAQQQGLQMSKEDLMKAFNTSNQLYSGAYSQIPDILKSVFGSQSQNLGTSFNNADLAKRWAYNQGSSDRTFGLNNALTSLSSGLSGAGSYLNPMSGMGRNAMTALQDLTFGKRSPSGSAPYNPQGMVTNPNNTGATGQSGQNPLLSNPWSSASASNGGNSFFGGMNFPTASAPSIPFPNTGSFPTSGWGNFSPNVSFPNLGSGTSGMTGGSNAMVTGASQAVLDQMGQENTKAGQYNPYSTAQTLSKAGTAAGFGGAIGGAIAKIAPNVMKSIGLTTLSATGVGALIGAGIVGAQALIGHFTKLGKDKESATRGIDALTQINQTDWLPKAKSGELKPEQYQLVLQAAFNDWSKLLPDDVHDRSVNSQLYWWNKGLADNGFKFQLQMPGHTANVNAGSKGYDQQGNPQ